MFMYTGLLQDKTLERGAMRVEADVQGTPSGQLYRSAVQTSGLLKLSVL